MHEADSWPIVSDSRLLAILQAQVTGALQDLNYCTDDGLEHLAKIIKMQPDSDLSNLVLAALTDLQRIDRVIQRLQNIANSLDEWRQSLGSPPLGRPTWLDSLTGRYVMPEEREVVAGVLNGSHQDSTHRHLGDENG